MLDTSQYVFHIVGGEIYDSKSSKARATTICGSSFYLGENCFLSAGHVVKNALENKTQAIGFLQEGKYSYREFEETETFDDFDLGIIKIGCSDLKLSKFSWSKESLDMLDPIYTFGFPYGFTKREETILITTRAFKGYIVNRGIQNPFYELSFNCPRGLSGAPLLSHDGKDKIVGMIVGNSITSINVYSREERTDDGASIHVHELNESIYFGQALQSQSFLEKESRLLKTSLKDFCKK